MSTATKKRIVHAEPGPTAARRRPVQRRSKERRDQILTCAETLIAATGSDTLKMSEIAAHAGISIGSLYQYFADKRAIVRALAERYADEDLRCIEEALHPVQDRAGLAAALSALVDTYHAMCRRSPVRRDTLAGMRADKELTAVELAMSQACAAVLAAAIRRVHPGADARQVDTTAFLFWQLGEETVRLALAHGRTEAERLVAVFKRMGLGAIAEVTASAAPAAARPPTPRRPGR